MLIRVFFFSLLPFAFFLANGDSINQDWYSQALNNIKKQEYHIAYSEETGFYQSPNRKNNLRFTYKNDGFIVTPRVTVTYKVDENNPLSQREKIEVSDEWKTEFKVLGYGRDGNIEKEFNGTELIVGNNSAHIEDPNMKIDYLNNEKGMRQDFTIYNKPQNDHGLLTLLFTIKTEEILLVGTDALVIKSKDAKEYMRYNSLKVWDAHGKILRGWFEKNNVNDEVNVIQIVVNDSDAKYPIVIDPLSSTADWTAFGGQGNALFGTSVATAGDVNGDGFSDVIIGANKYDNGQTDEGKVFVYHGSLNGPSAIPDWSVESDTENAEFGFSVATAGDVNGDNYSDVIIGAPYYFTAAQNGGKAFVYHGSSTGLNNSSDWSIQSNQADANLGYSVFTAGDVNNDGYSDVIVGAPFFDNGETDEGRIGVYHGSSTGLSSSINWSKEGGQSDAQLGYSTSTAGDVNGDGYSDIIVSAPNYDDGNNDEGRVYIYFGSSAGISSIDEWTVDGEIANLQYGLSVATAGDFNGDGFSDIIIGAPEYDNSFVNAGKIDVYAGSLTNPNLLFSWEGEEIEANLGKSVSTAGDVNGDGFADIIVGLTENTVGRANMYYGGSGDYNTDPDWTVLENLYPDNFGYCVATAGDVNGDGYSDIIIGANAAYNSFLLEGGAYLYFGNPDGINLSPAWSFDGILAESYYGCSVSAAGDVNGDGFSDVIFGAKGVSSGQLNEGMANVQYGSEDGLSIGVNWWAEGNQVDANFGWSTSTAGDVNGDGYDDVIVSAITYPDSAAVFVYYGSSGGVSFTADWIMQVSSNQSFGWSVSTAGDVNGDGYSDVIIGAPFFNGGTFEEGAAFVYHGSASGLSTEPDWVYESNLMEGQIGYSVSTAGDVNGDGYSDVIVGAPNQNEAYVFLGSSIGLSQSLNWVMLGDQPDSRFGTSVSTAGDVNGDGFSDILIGANQYEEIAPSQGKVFLYHGSSSGLSLTHNWSKAGPFGIGAFGTSVCTAGDLNSDGYGDVVIGNPFAGLPGAIGGNTYVYYGSPSGIIDSTEITLNINENNADFGRSVSTAGDINGDGFSDLIIGAEGVDLNRGATYLFYGNSDGLDSRLQQTIPSNGNNIAAGNSVQSGSNIKIAMRVKSPFGRAEGRILYETRKNGETFSTGTSLSNSVDFDDLTDYADLLTNSNGKSISQVLLNLSANNSTVFNWRVREDFKLAKNPFQRYGPWRYYKTYIPIQSYAFRLGVSVPSLILLRTKLFLEGPYSRDNDIMITALNDRIPKKSPYTESPASVNFIPPIVVDWILIELRDKNDSSVIRGSKSAFLTFDSKVVDLDGESPVRFSLPKDSYYIVVKHRNHLTVMSSEPVYLSPN